MRTTYYIGLDVHQSFTEVAVMTQSGKLIRRETCDTTIPALVEVIESIKRPRYLVFEEGALASWLSRNLRDHVDELVVCDPRRNHLITKDGDKDDPLDAEKLAHLYRGNYLRIVHQPETLNRALLKQNVGFYYDHINQRVRRGLYLLSQLRRHGEMDITTKQLKEEDPKILWRNMPKQTLLRNNLHRLWCSYQLLLVQETELRTELHRAARREEVVRRLEEVPGIGWLRAVTFFVYIDTPDRFKSKSALWKYCGIGLERQRSGVARTNVRLVKRYNRQLKNVVIGAAQTAAVMSTTPFGKKYIHWTQKEGLSHSKARRNLARCIASTLWSLWKTGDHYDPAKVRGKM